MRGLVFVVILAFLAGCSSPAADPPAPEQPVDDEPGRTARGDNAALDNEDAEELQPVELLHTPLTFAGQGPESFDLTVPPGIVAVAFTFGSGTSFQQSGLRIELSDCGTYDTGVGLSGSTGTGVTYSGQLCNEAPPGPATVTISATLLVFDGTFTLTGFTPIEGPSTQANTANP